MIIREKYFSYTIYLRRSIVRINFLEQLNATKLQTKPKMMGVSPSGV